MQIKSGKGIRRHAALHRAGDPEEKPSSRFRQAVRIVDRNFPTSTFRRALSLANDEAEAKTCDDAAPVSPAP